MEHVNAERLMLALSYRIRVWEASVNAVHHQLVTQQQVTNARIVAATAAPILLAMALT